MSADSSVVLSPDERKARTIKVVGLVSGAHFFSHFYMLLLPPLFPVLRDAYGVGYTELGLALTVYSLTTGLTQAPVGFAVDRFGARRILISGLLLNSLAIALIGLFPTYSALIVLMVVAGLANSVYHPADYVILNASVKSDRIGRAFSIHTTAGFCGDALAPITVLALMAWVGWERALIICGVGGGSIALLMAFNSSALVDVVSGEREDMPARGGGRTGLKLLFSLPVIMGFLFFAGISLSGKGVAAFSVGAFDAIYGVSLATAGAVLSAYLFASPVGVLVGGWIADKVKHHDRIVAGCFVVIATMIFCVAALDLSMLAIGVFFAIAGFCTGLVAPSRDMIIRSMTPPNEVGKVFGFVTTGFNLGGIVGPPLFGYLLDNGDPRSIFWVSGVLALATMVTVLITGRQGRKAT